MKIEFEVEPDEMVVAFSKETWQRIQEELPRWAVETLMNAEVRHQ